MKTNNGATENGQCNDKTFRMLVIIIDHWCRYMYRTLDFTITEVT